jgi:hypothetical protein
MNGNKSDWDGGEAGGRIDELDNEDLSVDELLDIEEKIEERIESYEQESEALQGQLYGEKMEIEDRKNNLSRKERIAEALEELEAQRLTVRSRLKNMGYAAGEDQKD